ncbi:uncharacterized protein LOC131841843 isoform X2 [Achroia grisella]|uniref:uncharacterized protein LOC131841843 isoform X2 n=1 Tax=Achroia grisella TaxID=688607 RepID=UPI0027D29412|nr:uncharacterized protein LOC131841843 isoform X2 [Achroia grisella]
MLPLRILYSRYCAVLVPKCAFSHNFEKKYSVEEKSKILQVINDTDPDVLPRYDIAKAKLKRVKQWKSENGQLKCIGDLEMIEGFSERVACKLFNSILEGPQEKSNLSYKIKGQILHPHLTDGIRQKCNTVLAVYTAVNSVCWTLIDKENYEVLEWNCLSLDYSNDKRLQLTDILNIAWKVTNKLPIADIYVMKAEPTTLRAAGSDPNNPKVLAINLQKSQMVSMIVSLITARSNDIASRSSNGDNNQELNNNVYFLRPALPYRLYGTLVGNEKVSTDQTVELLLQEINGRTSNNSKVYISPSIQSMYRAQKELQQDILGHCLLLGLTFMDLCIYKNQDSINKLARRDS